jgi:hypothetical protein
LSLRRTRGVIAHEGVVARAWWSWRGVRQLASPGDHVWRGSGLCCAQELAGAGRVVAWVSASSTRYATVGCRRREAVQKWRAGAMLKAAEGRRCSAAGVLLAWLGRSGVLHVPALGSAHVGLLGGLEFANCSVSQTTYVSVRPGPAVDPWRGLWRPNHSPEASKKSGSFWRGACALISATVLMYPSSVPGRSQAAQPHWLLETSHPIIYVSYKTK